MADEKNIKKEEEKRDIREQDSGRQETGCCYVASSCGCFDPCGCYVDPCRCC